MTVLEFCRQYIEKEGYLPIASHLKVQCWGVFSDKVPMEEKEKLVNEHWGFLCEVTGCSTKYSDLQKAFSALKSEKIDFQTFKNYTIGLRKSVRDGILELEKFNPSKNREIFAEVCSRYFLKQSHEAEKDFVYQFFFCALAHPDAADILLNFLKSDVPEDVL